jgi:hypothetical protein
MFATIALFSTWYTVAHRRNKESVLGGLCLTVPILVFVVAWELLSDFWAVYSLFLPLATAIAGFWLLVRRRFILGSLVILVAASWLIFVLYYLREHFAVYGD